jgi:hypothetical protein
MPYDFTASTDLEDQAREPACKPPAKVARAGRRYDDPMVEKDKKLVPGI